MNSKWYMKILLLTMQVLNYACLPEVKAQVTLVAHVDPGSHSYNPQPFVEVNTDTSSFISTWKTDMPGISNNSSITIPVHPTATYNYDVDWNNDGIFDTIGVTGSISNDYGTPGTYTIRIRGGYTNLYFNNEGDKEKIIDVIQWGDIQWNTMYKGFFGCKNLNISATDAPDLSRVDNLTSLFFGCTVFNSPVEHWDVSKVKKFYFTFGNCPNFNHPLNNWDMSSATNLQRMFIGCSSFNQPLDSWDVSQVGTFSAMFNNAISFNQAIGNWDTGNAIHFSLMFAGASSFNQDIGNWNTSKLRQIHTMFSKATNFNQDISNWDVSKVSNFKHLFHSAIAFNQNINSWDVSNATNMEWMFAGAVNFNQNIGNWDVSKVTNMNWMFFQAHNFNQDIGDWDVSQVNFMQNMLKGNPMSFNQDIGNWDVSNVVDMRSMFEHNLAFDQNLGNWNVSNVLNMERMFNLAKLSTPNYDSLLIGWNAKVLQNSVNFHGGFSQYCEGYSARENMIQSDQWVIQDGGPEITFPTAVCKDISVYLPPSGLLSIASDELDDGSFDQCGDINYESKVLNYDCNNIGVQIDTLIVSNRVSKLDTCYATITIYDTPFLLNCPEEKTVIVNTVSCMAKVAWEEPLNFCTIKLSSSHRSGDLFAVGTTAVNYLAVDAENNSNQCSFLVTVQSELSMQVDSLHHTDCLASANGQAFISVLAGLEPYTFDWSFDGFGDQDDKEDQFSLPVGTNHVTITDANGCAIVDSVSIHTSSLSIANCPSSQIINANYAGCSAIATWLEPVETCSGLSLVSNYDSGDVFDLGTTTVHYSATHTNGLIATCSFEIEVVETLEIALEQITSPTCAEAMDGSIGISIKGEGGPFAIDWNNDESDDFDDLKTIRELSAGNYVVEVMDASGCSRKDSFLLVAPESIKIIATTMDQGDKNKRLIDVSVVGGIAPYRFDWDIDSIGDYDDPEDLFVTTGGNYSLTVMDNEGCTSALNVYVDMPSNLCDEPMFKVYPNPNYGVFELEFEACEAIALIEVFDALGRKIYSKQTTGIYNTIELEHYSSGGYYLRVSTETESFVKPFTSLYR